jgi:Protein of unknown function (DUF2946)
VIIAAKPAAKHRPKDGRQATSLHCRPVFTARSHRRLTVCIALAAMLAFALLPTLSRAMAFAVGGSAWAEICTPQGLRLVATGDVQPSEAPLQAGLHLDHCKFCSMATDGAAPLPAAAPALYLPLGSAELPRAFLQAPATPHAWRTAQPRGPPAAA